MRGVGSIIKLFAGLFVIGLLVGLYFFVEHVQESFDEYQPASDEHLAQIVDEKDFPNFEPGQKEFHRALEFIATGRLPEAREKLSFIQKLHPNSPSGPEARRILGEINLDEILSIENMTNKKRHIVKGGDSFVKIARQYETTLDNIMFLNGLLEMRGLHPGDDLIVMPLAFRMMIDVARSRVELYEGKRYIKEYPIQRIDLPKFGRGTLKSKISLKTAEVRGRSYRPGHRLYRNGKKALAFQWKGRQFQLRSVLEADEEDPGAGVFISSNDMEELSMLIRLGNEVEMKPAG